MAADMLIASFRSVNYARTNIDDDHNYWPTAVQRANWNLAGVSTLSVDVCRVSRCLHLTVEATILPNERCPCRSTRETILHRIAHRGESCCMLVKLYSGLRFVCWMPYLFSDLSGRLSFKRLAHSCGLAFSATRSARHLCRDVRKKGPRK